MGKVHYGIFVRGWLDYGFIIRCGSKSGETTKFIEKITCKNCLRLIEWDLGKAKEGLKKE